MVIISECFEFNTEFIKVLEIQEDYLRLCIQKQERVSSCINHAIWKHEKNIDLHVKNSRKNSEYVILLHLLFLNLILGKSWISQLSENLPQQIDHR